MIVTRICADARSRIICLPCAGGSASAYAGWQAHAPAGLQVCAIELPGRGACFKAAALTTMEALIEHAEQACRDFVDLPFVLFGHSMGALAAYELALRMTSRALPLHGLVVSGCRAPHLPSRRSVRLFDLPEDRLRHELSRLEGLPPVFDHCPDLFRVFLPAIRADLRCREEWAASTRALDIQLAAVGGDRDDSVPESDLRAWQLQSTRPVAVRLFAGGHFYLRDHECHLVDHVARLLPP